MKRPGWVSTFALFTLVASATFQAASDHENVAHACSCMGPHLTFLSPMRTEAAPRNTHIRLEVPTHQATTPFVVRAHRGAAVATRSEVIAGPELTTVELVPLTALAAETRYEIALIDPNKHPSTTVIGTFKTGTDTDTTPPRLDSLGQVRNHLNIGHVGGGSCSIRGPWITVSGFVAQDPGRPEAALAFAVWKPDPQGRLDTKRAPDALLFPYRGQASIGQTSLCDPHAFVFHGATADLALAMVDEAGNRSATKRVRVDVTRPSP